jgi:hypothetical protein
VTIEGEYEKEVNEVVQKIMKLYGYYVREVGEE